MSCGNESCKCGSSCSCGIDCKCNTFSISEKHHFSPDSLPLLSKTRPSVSFSNEEIEELTVRIQNAGLLCWLCASPLRDFSSLMLARCCVVMISAVLLFCCLYLILRKKNHEFTAMLYPLLISSVGIIVCLITTLFATDIFEIKDVNQIEPALKNQLIISTALMLLELHLLAGSDYQHPSQFSTLERRKL